MLRIKVPYGMVDLEHHIPSGKESAADGDTVFVGIQKIQIWSKNILLMGEAENLPLLRKNGYD